MKKPTADTSQTVRLQAAAMAIRSFCAKRPRCGSICPFWSKGRKPECGLNMTPPSEWEIEIEEEENDSNVTRKI